MEKLHKALMYLSITGVILLIILELAVVFTRLSVCNTEYKTAQMLQEVARKQLETEQLRNDAYRGIIKTR